MTLIGILLALVAERWLGHLPGVGEPHLLEQIVVRVQRVVRMPAYWRSAAAPAVLLALAVAGIAGADYLLQHPLADLAFATGVLFLCLGPRDLAEDIHRLLAARAAGDEQAEQRLTRALLRSPERRTSKRSLIGAMFIQSHERLFGVLLWFFAAGPAGAVLYRVASRMPRFLHQTQPDSPAEASAETLHALAAWLPGRVTAMLLGMAGSLDQAIAEWRLLHRTQHLPWRQSTWMLLAEVSSASLVVEATEAGTVVPASLDDCLREVLAVQQRALLILLAAFGLFTIGAFGAFM